MNFKMALIDLTATKCDVILEVVTLIFPFIVNLANIYTLPSITCEIIKLEQIKY